MRTMMVLAALGLAARLAPADPAVTVEVHGNVPQVSLLGDFAGSRYTVYRGAAEAGPFAPVTQYQTLCVARCFADDPDAVPGADYWYRFDVEPSGGAPQRVGPYRVRIPAPYAAAFHLRVFPNPASAASRVEIYLRGAAADPPVPTRVAVLDLQGRRVRALWDGPLPRGLTTLVWDGRDDRGRMLGAGAWFVIVRSPAGSSVLRVVRAR